MVLYLAGWRLTSVLKESLVLSRRDEAAMLWTLVRSDLVIWRHAARDGKCLFLSVVIARRKDNWQGWKATFTYQTVIAIRCNTALCDLRTHDRGMLVSWLFYWSGLSILTMWGTVQRVALLLNCDNTLPTYRLDLAPTLALSEDFKCGMQWYSLCIYIINLGMHCARRIMYLQHNFIETGVLKL